MKLITSILVILVIIGCSTTESINRTGNEVIFLLDISEPDDDLFHVTAYPPDLGAENNVYNFVSTAPGTYSILDFGRFVKSFKAYDKNGNEITTENISTNKWEISQPEKVYKIEYVCEDSYDAEITENKISPMSGTGIEKDYVVMNTFGICGYFEGLQKSPVKMKIDYPEDWVVGTALSPDSYGYYNAESFDHFADSPFLIGDLSVASTNAGGIKVDVYVYAVDEAMGADTILALANNVLQAASEFISYTPVDRYVFLMALFDMETFQRNKFHGAGALEHSYSSLFAYPGMPEVISGLRGSMAHEFFHIMTPLNLHSEIITNYNFAEPTTSQHLWLYEGVTEWASDIMQLRGGVIDEKEYMATITRKLNEYYSRYDTTLSLQQLSIDVYNPEYEMQFGNVYAKGALVAGMMDLKLLELSNGEMGLRELFISLTKEYGRDKPFSEENFFNDFIERTYPEMEQFIDKYIKGTEPMPIVNYYDALGYNYVKELIDTINPVQLGIGFRPGDDGSIVIAAFSDSHENYGLQRGDKLVKIFGEECTFNNLRSLLDRSKDMAVGDEFEIVVKRGDEELSFTGRLFQRYKRHVFNLKEELTDEESKNRDAWLKNL